MWPTKRECLIEASKKQSETSQLNANWPAFKYAVYKPTVKRAMGYDEPPKK